MFVLILLGALMYLTYKFYSDSYQFWKKLNVPFKPPSLLFGNLDNFLFKKTQSVAVQIGEVYSYLKSNGHKFGGFYLLNGPIFLPVDLELIKSVLQRDFAHFHSKRFYINEVDQPLSANLFFIGGEKWKRIRVKMTPTFTSGKIKMMLSILLDCRQPMMQHIDHCCQHKIAFDIKETSARFTTDIIGSAAFGIECNSFKNPDAEFRRNGKLVFTTSYVRILKGIFMFNFQTIARFLHMVPFNAEAEKFFSATIKDTIQFRREHNVVKNDFMQMLMKLLDEGEITFDELVAQAFIFFLAGFETSSTTMTFCMYELAQNQDIQDKVRKEMRTVIAKYNGEITYEALGELVYTKQVIDETLRKYPPLPTIDRKCTQDYKIPGTDIILPKDTNVIISTIGVQHDPEHFPNPLKFDPDRFSPENIENIKPFSFLPFGEGPRLCIGQRFGILQTKIGLVTLLKDYRYTLNKDTSANLQIDFKFILSPIGNILLDIERVSV